MGDIVIYTRNGDRELKRLTHYDFENGKHIFNNDFKGVGLGLYYERQAWPQKWGEYSINHSCKVLREEGKCGGHKAIIDAPGNFHVLFTNTKENKPAEAEVELSVLGEFNREKHLYEVQRKKFMFVHEPGKEGTLEGEKSYLKEPFALLPPFLSHEH